MVVRNAKDFISKVLTLTKNVLECNRRKGSTHGCFLFIDIQRDPATVHNAAFAFLPPMYKFLPFLFLFFFLFFFIVFLLKFARRLCGAPTGADAANRQPRPLRALIISHRLCRVRNPLFTSAKGRGQRQARSPLLFADSIILLTSPFSLFGCRSSDRHSFFVFCNILSGYYFTYTHIRYQITPLPVLFCKKHKIIKIKIASCRWKSTLLYAILETYPIKNTRHLSSAFLADTEQARKDDII